MTEFGLVRHPQREGSPDAKIRSLSLFGRLAQKPGGLVCFLCPLESNWTRHLSRPDIYRRHFGGSPAALGQEALLGSFLGSATRLCAFSCFQDHPGLDSEEDPLIHKQGNMACKEH